MSDKFKVGDKVCSKYFGIGIVTSIIMDSLITFPIHVRFETGVIALFSNSGQYGNRSDEDKDIVIWKDAIYFNSSLPVVLSNPSIIFELIDGVTDNTVSYHLTLTGALNALAEALSNITPGLYHDYKDAKSVDFELTYRVRSIEVKP